jgi:hypothetical protein
VAFLQVQGSNVLISISYPADINTPGYARENINKPWEAAKLSESAGLQSPEKVCTAHNTCTACLLACAALYPALARSCPGRCLKSSFVHSRLACFLYVAVLQMVVGRQRLWQPMLSDPLHLS